MEKQTVMIPVTISIFVICETKVLVKKDDERFHFPSKPLVPGDYNCEEFSTQVLLSCVDFTQDSTKWLPVDIRSGLDEGEVFSLDIGYMTILDAVDIPETLSNEYKWIDVNFDDIKFPVQLNINHNELWKSAHMMFDMVRI